MDPNKQYRIDNAFGWQIDRPVFVKTGFLAFGKEWKPGDHFNWIDQQFRQEDFLRQMNNVHQLYTAGKIHHNSLKENETKVGDRLSEFKDEELMRFIRQVNDEIKKLCSTEKEFQNKKIKQSKIRAKQQGLIRSWLYRNPSLAENVYYPLRDKLLDT